MTSHTHEFRNIKGGIVTVQQPPNDVFLKGVMDVGTKHRILWKFTPIDFAGFAKNCGGKGYSIKKLGEVQQVMRTAMHDKEKKPTLIEAYVDPFEPIMPPKAKPNFSKKCQRLLKVNNHMLKG